MSFPLSGLSVRVALALGLACGAAAPAVAWDNLYIFGDSLSDTGNNGRYTFDSGRYPLYDEILASHYGVPVRQGRHELRGRRGRGRARHR